VLLSIQGLILGVPHPYFNEPGFGGWEGTEGESSRRQVGHVLATGKAQASEKRVPAEVEAYDQVERVAQ
jgi:hypothetical protein